MVHKPTFFIVGAPRSGTSAMFEYLRHHPGIFMPEYKAPFYFATDLTPSSPWAARYRTKEEYFQLFNDVTNQKEIGEASDLYLYSKTAAKNISNFNPKAKIIIMLRSPVDIMYSFFCLAFYSGVENASTFEEALLLENDRKKGINLPQNSMFMKYYYFYKDVVRFSGQLRRFFKVFPKKQIKVIIYEDFKKDAKKVYKETLSFLDVDSSFSPLFKRINEVKKVKNNGFQLLASKLAYFINFLGPQFFNFFKSIYKVFEKANFRRVEYPKIDPYLNKRLKKEFKNEVEEMGKIIGRDLNYWAR